MMFRKRSCVIGLCGETFSISRAMALASYATTLHQDLQIRADQVVINLSLDCHLQLFQRQKTPCFLGLVNRLRQFRRGSSAPRRIFKYVQSIKPATLQKLQRVFKFFLGLAREAYYYVTRKRNSAARILYRVDAPEVVLNFIAAAHRAQDTITAGLNRQVNPVAKVLIL